MYLFDPSRTPLCGDAVRCVSIDANISYTIKVLKN